jgi:hypothetical protein
LLNKLKIAFAFVCFCLVLPAQNIQNFNLALSGTSVILRWTLIHGNQCPGYNVYWSTDSVNFSPICNFTGPCGDPNNDQNYSYTHTGPIPNQNNYYKVEMTGLEMSPVRSIFVGTVQPTNMRLYPDPITSYDDFLNFKIYNASNIKVAGYIYNQYGKPLREVDLTTTVDTGTVPVGDLTNGLYVLWLTDGTVAYRAKFIVYR